MSSSDTGIGKPNIGHQMLFQPSMGESDREDKEPFGSALLTVSP